MGVLRARQGGLRRHRPSLAPPLRAPARSTRLPFLLPALALGPDLCPSAFPLPLAPALPPTSPLHAPLQDTFDGEDNVPPTLCTPGGITARSSSRPAYLHRWPAPPPLQVWQALPVAFARSPSLHARSTSPPLLPAEYAALVGAALHPRHGCFLLNLHSLEGSNASVAATFKAALLHAAGSGDGGDGGDSGSCLAVTVQRQRNVCVAVARGLAAPSGGVLRVAAADAAGEAGYRFAAGSRACHELRLL